MRLQDKAGTSCCPPELGSGFSGADLRAVLPPPHLTLPGFCAGVNIDYRYLTE